MELWIVYVVHSGPCWVTWSLFSALSRPAYLRWPEPCLMLVSRAWPAYLGELGCCLRHNLGSCGCFLEVGGWKVGNQRNVEKRKKNGQNLANFFFGLGGGGCVAAGAKVGYMGWAKFGLLAAYLTINVLISAPKKYKRGRTVQEFESFIAYQKQSGFDFDRYTERERCGVRGYTDVHSV